MIMNSGPKIRLYSLQHKKAWYTLQRSGVLTIENENLIEPDFLPAYRWMIGQMAKRIPNFSGHYPVWGWLRKGYRTNAQKWDEPQNLVLLTMEVPRERVLLSDFGVWHFVLNCHLLGDEICDTITYEQKKKSWERIFSQGPPDEGWFNEWQACIDQVFLNEIIDAKSIKDMKCKT